MNSDLLRKLMLGFLCLVVIAGAYVRLADLDAQFSEYDDAGIAFHILHIPRPLANLREVLTQNETAEGKTTAMGRIGRTGLRFLDSHGLLDKALPIIVSSYKFVSVPLTSTTTAPLQYVFTATLLSTEQTYRQILFFGRLPSAISGVLALLLIPVLFRMVEKDGHRALALTGVAILAFSWDNIIFSKHMTSYSMGVVSIILLIVILVHQLKERAVGFGQLMKFAIPISLISYVQYQNLPFVLVYFLVLFLFDYANSKEKAGVVRKFLVVGAFYLLLIAPLLFLMKTHGVNTGVNWNAGPNGEYAIGAGQRDLLQVINFYIRNFLIVFFVQTASTSEGSLPFFFLGALLAFLFFLGAASFFDKPNSVKKWLGVFFLCSAVAWGLLILMNKFSLSPSRHTLIFLPFFAIMAAFGTEYLCKRLKTGKRGTVEWLPLASVMLTAAIMSSFFLYSGQVSAGRVDEFNETRIKGVLDEFHPDIVISPDNFNLLLMKDVTNNYVVYHPSIAWNVSGVKNLRRVAFVSSLAPLNLEKFNEVRERMAGDNPGLAAVVGDLGDYDFIFSEERVSKIGTEFSNRTNGAGHNSLYFYVLAKK